MVDFLSLSVSIHTNSLSCRQSEQRFPRTDEHTTEGNLDTAIQ